MLGGVEPNNQCGRQIVRIASIGEVHERTIESTNPLGKSWRIEA